MFEKKKFDEPEIEVIRFDAKDVITASPVTPNGTYDDGDETPWGFLN